jgi:hypothetical protein
MLKLTVTDEIFAALIPMLLDGGQFISGTTPAGRRGWFHEAWAAERGKQIIAQSTELPRMKTIVDRDRAILSAHQFRAEHLLSFLGTGEAFFNLDAIDRAFQTDVPAINLSCLHAAN